MNLSRESNVFSTSTSSAYSNDDRSTSTVESTSGRRLSYFNWDSFEPDPNFWNIDDDDDDYKSVTPNNNNNTRASSTQSKTQQKDVKQQVSTPKKIATPQTKKTVQSSGIKTPQSLQKKVTKRPTAVNEPALSSKEAARMSASPLASKKPRTIITASPGKSSIASPKVKTPGKSVSFASALVETCDNVNNAKSASPAQRGVGVHTKSLASPSPAKSALKKNVTPSKTSSNTPSKSSTPSVAPVIKSVTNGELIKMIQEQNARIDRLAKDLEREKAARIALEKRLKFI